MEQRRPFGTLLRELRLAAGLTHEALAERSALSARAISDLERGVSRRPRRETVDLLIGALHLTPESRAAFEAAARSRGEHGPSSTSSGWGPGSLPVHLTSFVGREAELAAARALLRCQAARLATLTGPGGAGKSRLAVQLATELEGELADGVCYVELATVSAPDDVLASIARGLGVARSGGAAQLADLIDAVQDRHLLLVLDNFEHVLESAPVVAELLRRCPRLVVLATSRAPLRLSGERELPVLPLAVPPRDRALSTDDIGAYPSVRLFVDRAAYVRQGFRLTDENAAAVAGICARLDGLPLALELAAARSKMLAPGALLQRLDGTASGSALRLLTRGTRDVPPHQRTLRDTMLWSYDLLTPAEQRLLRRLAIFAGGCTLAAAEAIAGDGSWVMGHGRSDGASPSPDTPYPSLDTSVFEGLSSLVDKSLVYLAEGADGEQRFLLLETVRELGLEQLREAGEYPAMARAHATYYLEQVKGFGALLFAGPAERQRSVAEYHNLQEALRWLFRHG
jgi:predicted ATPase/transcriptional regulator with XRE-family HTH domain